jgi:hypothetical protein
MHGAKIGAHGRKLDYDMVANRERLEVARPVDVRLRALE